MPGPNSTPRVGRFVGKTAVKRSGSRKSDSYIPKTLAARIEGWETLPKANNLTPNVKSIDGNAYRKPGSQNKHK